MRTSRAYKHDAIIRVIVVAAVLSVAACASYRRPHSLDYATDAIIAKLTSVQQFAADFNAQSSHKRLILLLSPT